MSRERVFNTEGLCVPSKHYMADTSPMVREIIDRLIDKGKYFTINRSRQYGKTTTLDRLDNALRGDHTVVSISLEGVDTEALATAAGFSAALVGRIRRALRHGPDSALANAVDLTSDVTGLDQVWAWLDTVITASAKPAVLIIDEVDAAVGHQPALDFLGLLRTMYLDRERLGAPAFQSVVLAGVTDVQRLRAGVRPDEAHALNSPWNIAVPFDVDMSFHPDQIATMLDQYEADHDTGMDVHAVSERVYHYTAGYPFLVSALAKTIAESGGAIPWTRGGVDAAESRLVKDDEVSLFRSLNQSLERDEGLRAVAEAVVVRGDVIPFRGSDPAIDLGRMFGVLASVDGHVAPSNRMFETRMLDYFLSVSATRSLVAGSIGPKSQYIETR